MWRRIFKSHLRHSFFLLTLFNVIKTKKEKSLMSHLFVLDIKMNRPRLRSAVKLNTSLRCLGIVSESGPRCLNINSLPF